MLFHVQIEVRIPVHVDRETVERLGKLEHERAAELQRAGRTSKSPLFADTRAPFQHPLKQRRMRPENLYSRFIVPWINLTLRQGALPKPVQHSLMAKLTEVLMWWEKVPDTPRARSIMGWVYEVERDADYSAGSPMHEKPFYFVEVRIPVNRLDLLAKEGLIRDITHVVLAAEVAEDSPSNARRVWVTINEMNGPDWGIGGHADWLRDYTSALDEVGAYKAPT